MSTISVYPEQEEALRESLGFLWGEMRSNVTVPHAGGGEGLYIAPRHTEVQFGTVDDALRTLYRYTSHTRLASAGSCPLTATGVAQPHPVG